MSKLEKTGLIGRIVENALNGEGIVPADVVELAELLDKNTLQTAKLYDQVQRLESEKESLSELLAKTTAANNQRYNDLVSQLEKVTAQLEPKTCRDDEAGSPEESNDLEGLEIEKSFLDQSKKNMEKLNRAVQNSPERPANDPQFEGVELPEGLQRVLSQFRDKPTIFIVSAK